MAELILQEYLPKVLSHMVMDYLFGKFLCPLCEIKEYPCEKSTKCALCKERFCPDCSPVTPGLALVDNKSLIGCAVCQKGHYQKVPKWLYHKYEVDPVYYDVC